MITRSEFEKVLTQRKYEKRKSVEIGYLALLFAFLLKYASKFLYFLRYRTHTLRCFFTAMFVDDTNINVVPVTTRSPTK